MPLSNLTITRRSTPNYTPSRPGNWPTGPVAFVLQQVAQDTLEAFDVETQAALPRGYNTDNPKSLHFLVDRLGNIHQYVDVNDTAWGINDFSNPSWPGVGTYAGNFSTEINAAFIHIGFTQRNSLTPGSVMAVAKIIAALCADFNLTVSTNTVIVARSLTDQRRSWDLKDLPLDLLTFAQAELAGIEPTPLVDALTQLVQVLSAGLAQAQQDIINLQARVAGTELYGGQIFTLENDLTGLQGVVGAADLPQMQSDLSDALATILILQATIQAQQACIDEVCPPPGTGTTINYQLQAGSSAVLTPGADVRLNLATQIADTEPASVVIGPLWNAHVEVEGTWTINVAFSCPALEWTNGKKVWLDLVTSNGNTRIAEWTAPSAGVHSATASGASVRIVPPTTDMYLRAGTNEVAAPGARVITYAALTMSVV